MDVVILLLFIVTSVLFLSVVLCNDDHIRGILAIFLTPFIIGLYVITYCDGYKKGIKDYVNNEWTMDTLAVKPSGEILDFSLHKNN